MLEKLDELAQSNSTLCIESTGTAYTFLELLTALHLYSSLQVGDGWRQTIYSVLA